VETQSNFKQYQITGRDAYKNRAAARTLNYLVNHRGEISKEGLFMAAEHKNNPIIGLLRKWFGNSERSQERQKVALDIFYKIATDLSISEQDPMKTMLVYAKEVAGESGETSGILPLDFEDGVKFSYNIDKDKIESITINARRVEGAGVKRFFKDLQVLRNEIPLPDNSQSVDEIDEATKVQILDSLKSLSSSQQLESLQNFRDCNSLTIFFNGNQGGEERERTVNLEAINKFSQFLDLHEESYASSETAISKIKDKLLQLQSKQAEGLTYSQVTGIAFDTPAEQKIFQDYWIRNNSESYIESKPTLQSLKKLANVSSIDIRSAITATDSELQIEDLRAIANVFAGGTDLRDFDQAALAIIISAGIVNLNKDKLNLREDMDVVV